jgi:hypothetical protein
LIPPPVEIIDKRCFYECSSLIAVVFEGDSCLREVKSDAFRKCVALMSFSVPKAVQQIDPSAFRESGVKSFFIDEANQYFAFDQGLLLNHPRTHLIQSFSFSESISIPSTVDTLGNFSFEGNGALVAIQIPNKIEGIPRSSFSNCFKLCDLSFESGSRLRRIDDSAFFECSSLNFIIVPASVEVLASCCFKQCWSLTVVAFECDSRLKRIENSAFAECSSLRTFDLPASVEVIFSHAFDNCERLCDFCVPRDSHLQRIERQSFQGCFSLTSFHIPSSIKFIGHAAFPPSCKFEVGGGNQANTIREWCV